MKRIETFVVGLVMTSINVVFYVVTAPVSLPCLAWWHFKNRNFKGRGTVRPQEPIE